MDRESRSSPRRASIGFPHTTLTDLPDWARAAREHWQWRGSVRPPFAQVPLPGQQSVWDFPRPPSIVADEREVVIVWGGVEIALTTNAVRVCETGHPPSFYLPLDDVATRYLRAAPGNSFCEWKGPARYWSLDDGARVLTAVGWSYPTPLAGAEILADRIAFYPARLSCRVGGAPVTPQPGGFYGGWITPELAGPFKGAPGSDGW